MNKILILLSLLLVAPAVTLAQSKTVFMFNDFIKVKVLFKNKTQGQVVANYDAGQKRLMFKQGDDMLESTNTATIDTIYFGERRFIPAKQGMHEVMRMPHGNVKIDWSLRDVLIGSKGAFGSVTQGTVQHVNMATFGGSDLGNFYHTRYENSRENDNEIFRRHNSNVYYVTVGGKEYKFKDMKGIYKQFPEKAEAVKAYAGEHKLDLRTADNALKVLDYLLGLF
ncbi:MAG: hypothetical protein HUJ98_09205 [Bacteroidaceae bacterium]|nr:hypothetical protein [Bacteroidaceae bacterium]MCF0186646.1 hypothetical protein [Bacteroidaceae bacterium]